MIVYCEGVAIVVSSHHNIPLTDVFLCCCLILRWIMLIFGGMGCMLSSMEVGFIGKLKMSTGLSAPPCVPSSVPVGTLRRDVLLLQHRLVYQLCVRGEEQQHEQQQQQQQHQQQ